MAMIEGISINDEDREQWADNDESLYLLWRRFRGSKRAFIRAHRAEIDRVVRAVLSAEPLS